MAIQARHQIIAISCTIAALALGAHTATAQRDYGFGMCTPRSQRAAGAVGCFIVADQPVGVLDTAPVFWYIARFDSHEQATAAAPKNGTVIDAFDTSWLMMVGDAHARPHVGTLVATIGPVPVTPGTPYSALYMEASMRPGMKSAIHRHSGPELWYTLSGETCLETPSGTMVGRAGGPPVIVPGGPPMELTATGTGIRRSLVLILHDARKKPTTMESTWKATGRCR